MSSTRKSSLRGITGSWQCFTRVACLIATTISVLTLPTAYAAKWLTDGTTAGTAAENAIISEAGNTATITMTPSGVSEFVGGSETDLLRISEYAWHNGSFTIAIDDYPLYDVILYLGSIGYQEFPPDGEIAESSAVGNFQLSFSDGTVINDAPFTLTPADNAAGPLTPESGFTTFSSDTHGAAVTTIGGLTYVHDPFDSNPLPPNLNAFDQQAYGYLIFPTFRTP